MVSKKEITHAHIKKVPVYRFGGLRYYLLPCYTYAPRQARQTERERERARERLGENSSFPFVVSLGPPHLTDLGAVKALHAVADPSSHLATPLPLFPPSLGSTKLYHKLCL